MSTRIKREMVVSFLWILLPVWSLFGVVFYALLTVNNSYIFPALIMAVVVVGVKGTFAYIDFGKYTRGRLSEFETLTSSELHPVIWEAITAALSSTSLKPEVYVTPSSTNELGEFFAPGFKTSFAISLREDLEEDAERARAVAAHEVGHMVLQHSLITWLVEFFTWVQLVFIVILAVNIGTDQLKVVHPNWWLMLPCLWMIWFAANVTFKHGSVLMRRKEYSAWLWAAKLIGFRKVFDFLESNSGIAFGIMPGPKGELRVIMSESPGIQVLRRMNWAYNYQDQWE